MRCSHLMGTFHSIKHTHADDINTKIANVIKLVRHVKHLTECLTPKAAQLTVAAYRS